MVVIGNSDTSYVRTETNSNSYYKTQDPGIEDYITDNIYVDF